MCEFQTIRPHDPKYSSFSNMLFDDVDSILNIPPLSCFYNKRSGNNNNKFIRVSVNPETSCLKMAQILDCNLLWDKFISKIFTKLEELALSAPHGGDGIIINNTSQATSNLQQLEGVRDAVKKEILSIRTKN